MLQQIQILHQPTQETMIQMVQLCYTEIHYVKTFDGNQSVNLVISIFVN